MEERKNNRPLTDYPAFFLGEARIDPPAGSGGYHLGTPISIEIADIEIGRAHV